MPLTDTRFRSAGDGALAKAQESLLRSVDLEGKTFCDIGGYDGTIAALALDLGAARATVIDNGEWEQYGWPTPDRDPRVLYEDTDFREVAYVRWARADVVACFNVLYHLEDPIGGLRDLREMAKERLLLCTSVVKGPEHFWRLYDHTDSGERIPEGATEYTVWFKPTVTGLERAMARIGFTLEGLASLVGDHYLAVFQ